MSECRHGPARQMRLATLSGKSCTAITTKRQSYRVLRRRTGENEGDTRALHLNERVAGHGWLGNVVVV